MLKSKNQGKLLLLIFICGVLAATALGGGFYKADRARIANEFQKDVVQLALSSERDVNVTFESLYTLVGLFSGSSEVLYEDFRGVAAAVLARHPSIKHIEWAPLVDGSNRLQVEKFAQSYSPGFYFKELDGNGGLQKAAVRDEYMPILYAMPELELDLVMGLDLASAPNRFKILARSRANREMMVSNRTALVESTDGEKDYYFVFVPVFAGSKSASSQPEFCGFVVGVFKVGEILENSLKGSMSPNIELCVQKFTESTGVDQFFKMQSADGELQNDMLSTYRHNIAGNTIIYSAVPSVEYVQNRRSNSAYIAFFFSLVLTIIVCAFTYLLQQKLLVISQQAEHLGRANLELERMSKIDGLTGVANRRCFDETLAREWRLSYRNAKPMALIMIDIDYFKLFNDTYGHQAGDECLRKVAQVLQKSISRPTDLVARYGGEEFAIILPDTGNNGAVVARRCCTAVKALAIKHNASLVSSRVTISAGVSSAIPQPKYDSAGLLKEADTALYTAKENGRDRVEIA